MTPPGILGFLAMWLLCLIPLILIIWLFVKIGQIAKRLLWLLQEVKALRLDLQNGKQNQK